MASATNAQRFEWNGNEGDQFLTTDIAGDNIVTAFSPAGCQSQGVVKLKVFNSPIVQAPNDTTVCFDNANRVIISPTTDSTNYNFTWSNGELTQDLVITSGGVYAVTATNNIGCSTTDEVFIDTYCPWTLFVPNSFTPNDDGVNDYFEPKGLNLLEYQILIFNRWGTLIYTGNSINETWDGTYKGEEAQIDVYVYKIIYQYESPTGIENDQKVGTVNLLR